ncbi:MAG TPA: glycosyltransferase, partial [Streptosporangiaceae bacterium]|nr:glycosyltransferase [Streptosporangiaceae bacterium]
MTGRRVIVHGPHPDMPTGYANQLREIVPRLARDGWEVAISCTAGIVRHNTAWRGFPVYGRSPYTDMAEDLIGHHYEDFGADLVITLCCPWKLHGQVWQPMRTIHLMPVDRDPLGRLDWELLATSGGMPAAVSRFGERVLRDKGLDPLYLPHAVDTSRWRPPADRAALRRANGLDHLFTVGLNASNTDPADRKSFYETFAGFARFRAQHPMSVLLVHAASVAPDGLNLTAMARHLGITESVIFSNQYQLAGAGAPDEALAAWYGMQDVHVLISKGEGYGIPLAEAQACGTPVITMGWSTGPELAGPGWTVAGQPSWNNGHAADWHVPFIDSIAEKLGEAHAAAAGRREAARQFA